MPISSFRLLRHALKANKPTAAPIIGNVLSFAFAKAKQAPKAKSISRLFVIAFDAVSISGIFSISAAPKRPKMPIAGIATIGTSIARPNFDRFVIKAFHSFFILLPPIGTSRCTIFAVGQQNYPQ